MTHGDASVPLLIQSPSFSFFFSSFFLLKKIYLQFTNLMSAEAVTSISLTTNHLSAKHGPTNRYIKKTKSGHCPEEAWFILD